MRRFGALLLLTITLLAGCGGRESPVSPDEAPETALTEQDVINMYTAASAVYDWFDLTTLPLLPGGCGESLPARFYRGRAHGQCASLAAAAGHDHVPGRPAGDGGVLLLPGDCGQPLRPVPGSLQGLRRRSLRHRRGPREQPVPAGQDRGGGAGGCGPLDGDGHLLRRQLGL